MKNLEYMAEVSCWDGSEFYDRDSVSVDDMTQEEIREKLHEIVDTAVETLSVQAGCDVLSSPGYALVLDVEYQEF